MTIQSSRKSVGFDWSTQLSSVTICTPSWPTSSDRRRIEIVWCHLCCHPQNDPPHRRDPLCNARASVVTGNDVNDYPDLVRLDTKTARP